MALEPYIFKMKTSNKNAYVYKIKFSYPDIFIVYCDDLKKKMAVVWNNFVKQF